MSFDNLFTGAEANIEHLKDNPLFEFVHHDVEFPYHTKLLMKYTIELARRRRYITNVSNQDN